VVDARRVLGEEGKAMRGSIQKKGRMYYVVLAIGPKRKWLKVSPNKKEAERVLVQEVARLHSGSYRELKKITFATLLIAQGESPKYIQAQLGHASIQVTMDRYGHLLPDMNQQAARRVEDSLFGPSVRKPLENSGF
jgi:hypothetical protein